MSKPKGNATILCQNGKNITKKFVVSIKYVTFAPNYIKNDMSSPSFDLSQFYTRRNSNYNVTPENENNTEAASDKVKAGGNGKDDCGETRIPLDSDGAVREICGFLFSISKEEKGEYWPVRIGNNSIGNSSDCNVTLVQSSVKPAHATLVAERDQGKITMRISCESSVLVNGLEVMGETTCRDRDILTIGNAYQLLLLIADKEKYGLAKAENFDEEEKTNVHEPVAEESLPAEEEGTVFLQ